MKKKHEKMNSVSSKHSGNKTNEIVLFQFLSRKTFFLSFVWAVRAQANANV